MVETGELIPMDTDTWNIAKGFSFFHVLVPLVETRRLVNISLYGVEKIEDQLLIPPNQIILSRINGLNRLLTELQQIVDDCSFVMDKTSKKHMDKIATRLKEVAKVISAVSKKTTDVRTKAITIKLNEFHFDICLDELRSILSDIKKPLNMKNLIFPASDELDIEAIKREIIEGG